MRNAKNVWNFLIYICKTRNIGNKIPIFASLIFLCLEFESCLCLDIYMTGRVIIYMTDFYINNALVF